MGSGLGPSIQTGGEDAAIRLILEGTAAETGGRFFEALVRKLAEALGVTGAWVTEYLREAGRLRSLAFWFEDRHRPRCEYDIAGTPCEPVIKEARLAHFRADVAALFPGDTDLRRDGAVSYIGVPLFDTDGSIMGHLAALDRKEMPLRPRLEALFRIFAARAAAELQRLRAEERTRHREEQLSRLLESAMDAVIELDGALRITGLNRSAAAVFGCQPARAAGHDFHEFLEPESGRKLARLIEELETRPPERQYLWIPGGLKAVRPDGARFPAEASLSRYEVRGTGCFTLILRNVNDQVEAERKLEFLRSQSAYLAEQIEEMQNYREIAGESRVIREMVEMLRQVAPTSATVLICGETGTGKELVARAVHAGSPRAPKPLIKVNCAAIPASLMESEFFGHERGAFTGATARREGRFALAHEGTIFLDEAGELPLDLQPKLLRVLQEGEFEPVGSSRSRKVDVRVIAATNRDLGAMVKEGRFREDLYYRLNVFPVRVPPLRERGGDIELLAAALARQIGRKMGRKVLPPSPEDVRRLRAYDWPGNVRELQNVIERAVITSRNGALNLDAVLPRVDASPAPAADHEGPEPPILSDREMRELERANILRALERAGWRVAGPNGAARLLGVPPSTLGSRMDVLGIRRPR